MPNMTGPLEHRTLQMNGGSSASHLACAPFLRLVFCVCVCFFLRVGKRRAFRLPGEGGDNVHCTVEPLPGHIRRRKMAFFSFKMHFGGFGGSGAL